MSLQYLEALKALGSGPATKFIIPMEFTHLLDPFVDFLAPAGDGDAPSGGGSRATRSIGPKASGPAADTAGPEA